MHAGNGKLPREFPNDPSSFPSPLGLSETMRWWNIYRRDGTRTSLGNIASLTRVTHRFFNSMENLAYRDFCEILYLASRWWRRKQRIWRTWCTKWVVVDCSSVKPDNFPRWRSKSYFARSSTSFHYARACALNTRMPQMLEKKYQGRCQWINNN